MKININNLSFSEQVKTVRVLLQLTQTELAQQIGISYATVSRWERENRTPHLAMVGKFYSFCMRNEIELDMTKKEE